MVAIQQVDVAARFLRLWPGLLVVLLLTAFLLGPLVTTLDAGSYFASPATLAYVPRNLSLAFRNDVLPGVFAANPLTPSTNGSLWSLFYEVACYGAVVLAGYAGIFARNLRFCAFFAFAVAIHGVSVIAEPAGGLAYRLDTLAFVGFPFALGMACYAWREVLPLGLLGVTLSWLGVLLLSHTPFLGSAIMAALVYSTLWLAFIPKGFLLAYNRLGDASYGVYIYAFPVQQTLVHRFPGMTPWQNILAAAPIVLLLAAASWILVEKRALGLQRSLGAWLAQSFASRGEGAGTTPPAAGQG